ncbi:MAG: YdeI/OmpD-associated family protein [Actinomycetia bacterium]|nr:YdeI/OmpD-associated family protein [Actinomycetes bacterium]
MALEKTVTLEPFGPATAIILTDEEVADLGGGRRAPVRVTVDGHTVRMRVAVMGGLNCIGISKANRAELGVQIGDEITALIELDETPREVEVPADLAVALGQDPEAARAFAGLAFTHRKEFAQWVGDAKREDTRTRRVAQTLEMLRSGQTRS